MAAETQATTRGATRLAAATLPIPPAGAAPQYSGPLYPYVPGPNPPGPPNHPSPPPPQHSSPGPPYPKPPLLPNGNTA